MPVPGKMCLPVPELYRFGRFRKRRDYTIILNVWTFFQQAAILPAWTSSPSPPRSKHAPARFRLTAQTDILTDLPNRWNADLSPGTPGRPHRLPAAGAHLRTRPGQNSIRLHLDPGLESLGREGYRLTVSPDGSDIGCSGNDWRLLRHPIPAPVAARSKSKNASPSPGWIGALPVSEITDRPRFAWRGFMLDEGRHFQGRETVLQTLDLMALQKLNVFHWHLTEDQGWRIEIKKYPRLTEIGSRRLGTRKGFTAGKHDGIPHGGFYTQAEIREIVAYAAERHITDRAGSGNAGPFGGRPGRLPRTFLHRRTV